MKSCGIICVTSEDAIMLIATENLSRSEKLRIIEQLWDELSRDPGSVESPAWHADALREAEARVANGEAKFLDWEQAKARLRQGDA
jgi:putative addiction module component (TIGR02574 family)